MHDQLCQRQKCFRFPVLLKGRCRAAHQHLNCKLQLPTVTATEQCAAFTDLAQRCRALVCDGMSLCCLLQAPYRISAWTGLCRCMPCRALCALCAAAASGHRCAQQ
jgi:hypothetical protein